MLQINKTFRTWSLILNRTAKFVKWLQAQLMWLSFWNISKQPLVDHPVAESLEKLCGIYWLARIIVEIRNICVSTNANTPKVLEMHFSSLHSKRLHSLSVVAHAAVWKFKLRSLCYKVVSVTECKQSYEFQAAWTSCT